MRLEHIRDTPVEALDHPVGLGRSGPGEPVLDAQLPAQPVKLVMSAGLTLWGKQPIREFLAVVDQHLVDFDQAALVQSLQKRFRMGSALAGLDLHKPPNA